MKNKKKILYAFANEKKFLWLEKYRNKITYPIASLLVSLNVFYLAFPLSTKQKLIVLASTIIGNVLVWISNLIFTRHNNWLSSQVWSSLNTIEALNFPTNPKFFKSLLSLETLLSVLFYTSLVAITWLAIFNFPLLANYKSIITENIAEENNLREYINTLWQVDAAIVSLTFVVLTLLLELVRTYQPDVVSFIMNKIKLTKLLLLNFVLLIPLGFSGLFITTNGKALNNFVLTLSFTIFVYSLLSIVYLFKRSIVFIDQSGILQSINESFRSIIQEIFLDELYVRIAQNELIKIGETNNFSGSGIDFNENQPAVKYIAKNKSRVVDINVAKLIRISNSLTGTINSRGEKFSVCVHPDSYLDQQNNVVARVSREEFSTEIGQKILSCFKFRAIDNKEIDATDSINALRDQASSSIQRNLVKSYKDSLETYMTIYDNFYSTLAEYNIRFDFNAARSAFIETRSMRIVERSVKDVFEEAFKSKNESIILDTLYFPKRLLSLALKYKDHLLFRQGIHLFSFSLYLYYKYNIPSISGNKVIADRLHRHLTEFSDYELFNLFENTEYMLDNHDFLQGVLIESILLYNQYMKECIEHQDFNLLKDINSSFNNIHSRLLRNFNIYDHLKDTIEFSDDAEKETKLSKLDKILKMQEEIEQHKILIKYGLASWSISSAIKQRLDSEFVKSFYKLLGADFNSLKKLIEIFFMADNREWKNIYGWDWWRSEDHEDGVAYSVDMNWLKTFYIVRALNLLNISKSDVTLKALPKTQDSKNYSSLSLEHIKKELSVQIDTLEKDTETVKPFIETDFAESKEKLLQIHEAGIKELRITEERNLENAPISDQKVHEFFNEFHERWERDAIVRKIFESSDRIIKIDKKPTKTSGYRGFNNIEHKELFIDEPISSYSGWGESYGSGLAMTENTVIFEKLIKGVRSKRKTNAKKLIKSLDKAIEDLLSRSYTPDIILTNASVLYRIDTQGKFRNAYEYTQEKLPKGISGFYKDIPVIPCSRAQDELFYVVFDSTKIGEIRHYIKGSQKDIFYYSVRIFDDSVFEELIKDNPKLIAEKNPEVLKKELQSKVWVKLFESFVFNIKSSNAGISLEVTK